MMTQEQVEDVAHKAIERYVSDCHCNSVGDVQKVLQKLQAKAGLAYMAIVGQADTLAMLETLHAYLGKEEFKNDHAKIEIIERGSLNG